MPLRLAEAGSGPYRTVWRGTTAGKPATAFRRSRGRVPQSLRTNEPRRPPPGFIFETPPLYGLVCGCSALLLDLMVHDMMLHVILRVCRIPRRSRRAELGHE